MLIALTGNLRQELFELGLQRLDDQLLRAFAQHRAQQILPVWLAPVRAIAFAQLTWRESLRDIEASLSANASKLYAMGFRSPVRRSTPADANESRDWRIWADSAAVLIRRARELYASESLGVELDNTVYALDSSTIDLCLSCSTGSRSFHQGRREADTLLELRGSIPAFIHISDSKLHDVNVMDLLAFEAGASTLWIAVIWTSQGITGCTKPAPSLSPAPSRTSMPDGCTPLPAIVSVA